MKHIIILTIIFYTSHLGLSASPEWGEASGTLDADRVWIFPDAAAKWGPAPIVTEAVEVLELLIKEVDKPLPVEINTADKRKDRGILLDRSYKLLKELRDHLYK